MIRRPPRSTRTDTLFPYTPLFRSDGVLAQLGADGNAVPMAGGTPAGMTDDIVLLDYGDEEAALETLARLGDAVAAVLVEPVQGRRPDRQPRQFLQRLRAQKIGRAHG